MRASTVGSRFLDRCGDSLGVESSFKKDICMLAAVLTVDAEVHSRGEGGIHHTPCSAIGPSYPCAYR